MCQCNTKWHMAGGVSGLRLRPPGRLLYGRYSVGASTKSDIESFLHHPINLIDHTQENYTSLRHVCAENPLIKTFQMCIFRRISQQKHNNLQQQPVYCKIVLTYLRQKQRSASSQNGQTVQHKICTLKQNVLQPPG